MTLAWVQGEIKLVHPWCMIDTLSQIKARLLPSIEPSTLTINNIQAYLTSSQYLWSMKKKKWRSSSNKHRKASWDWTRRAACRQVRTRMQWMWRRDPQRFTFLNNGAIFSVSSPNCKYRWRLVLPIPISLTLPNSKLNTATSRKRPQ